MTFGEHKKKLKIINRSRLKLFSLNLEQQLKCIVNLLIFSKLIYLQGGDVLVEIDRASMVLLYNGRTILFNIIKLACFHTLSPNSLNSQK